MTPCISCTPAAAPRATHRGRVRGTAPALLALAVSACGIGTAFAQSADGEIAELRRQLEALKAEQAERDRRIEALEAALRRVRAAAPAATAAAPATAPAPAASPAATPAPAAAATAAAEPRLKITGDLRLRAQGDYSDSDGRNRNSSQLRGRLGATYAVSDRVTIGGRLATGDPDDPNSTDVQLSNFLDDLEVSLDMAYLQFNFGDLKLYGGKMPMPFTRTDLVWDGDVNPQGAAAVYKRALAGGGAFRANGLFFVVDEQAAGPDSTMLGGQFGFDSPAFGHWKYDLSAGYYHYDLGSTAGGDGGDFRSNLLNPDGSYRSDFRLVDLVGGVTYGGFGEQWPLRLVGDYVRNLGAATDADTGYGADLSLGKASAVGDWRFTYGYSVAETDAVLAAFSHDNIGIATNYRLHALTVDYVPTPKTMLTAIWYHYKPFSAVYAGSHDPDDWLDRFRLAFLVNF